MFGLLLVLSMSTQSGANSMTFLLRKFLKRVVILSETQLKNLFSKASELQELTRVHGLPTVLVLNDDVWDYHLSFSLGAVLNLFESFNNFRCYLIN